MSAKFNGAQFSLRDGKDPNGNDNEMLQANVG